MCKRDLLIYLCNVQYAMCIPSGQRYLSNAGQSATKWWKPRPKSISGQTLPEYSHILFCTLEVQQPWQLAKVHPYMSSGAWTNILKATYQHSAGNTGQCPSPRDNVHHWVNAETPDQTHFYTLTSNVTSNCLKNRWTQVNLLHSSNHYFTCLPFLKTTTKFSHLWSWLLNWCWFV